MLTFAVPTMRGELLRYFRDVGWVIRPPRRIQENQHRLHHATTTLQQRLGREPDRHELAAELSLTEHEYADTIAAYGAFAPTSLDRPTVAEATVTVAESLTAPDQHHAAETRVLIMDAIAHLPVRDRKVIYLRFFEDLTQREIGEVLGVTQMQISRTLQRILRDMRLLLGDAIADN